MRRPFAGLILCLILLSAAPISAQTQCGVVNRIDFPVDPARFTVMQAFGAQSYRHQGRYHTGEDWFGGEVGEYVRAIARGRVTFSSPNGWGRDGGVIIVEHNFPDGSVAYSMYGHITDQTGVQFPPVYSCVEQGDVLAAIGDARPAPHVHIEIRTSDPNIPGAGYTWTPPLDAGLRRPTKFIVNWQTWLADSYRWRADLADESGAAADPVVLSDLSLIALDSALASGRVIRVSSDGRILWRVTLDQTAVALLPAINDGASIAFAGGQFQRVNGDGTLGERWDIGMTLAGVPLTLPDRLIFPTSTGLAALSADARALLWTLDGIAPVARWIGAGDHFGVMTTRGDMLTISADGAILDAARLREPGSLAFAERLIAYTRGGVWSIDGGGVWSPLLDTAPSGGDESAVTLDAQNRLFLWDGDTLYGYNAERFGLWQLPLPGVDGQAALHAYENALLLVTTHGDLIAVQPESGGVCNRTRIYGSDFARVWFALGTDGIMRVHIADQVIGLDWEEFLLACGQ